MNKKEVIREVAKRTKNSFRECSKTINALSELVKEALSKGEEVSFAGLGKFGVKTRAERKYINPQTMREIYVLPKKVPVFKTSKVLKDSIR